MIIRGHESPFTPYEVVSLRRSLITAGEYADCPRCHTRLVVERARISRAAGWQLRCDQCGGSLPIRESDLERLAH